MQVKTCAATIKAAGPDNQLDEGVVEAIVATYDVDSIGDRIMPGAFAESLGEWQKSGNSLPFIWSHKSDDPEAYIGVVEHAEEVPGVGLKVRARIDMDEPKALKAYKLMKGRRVTNFSFSYDETDARPAPKDDSGAKKDLFGLKVYECGPTLIGCNQRTDLVSAKADPTPAAPVAPASEQEKAGETSPSDDLVAVLMKAGWAPPVDPAMAAACAASEKAIDTLTVEVKAAPPGFTPKPIVARIRKLVAAAQALLDSVEPPKTDDSKAMPSTPAATPAAPAKGDVPAAPGAASTSRLRTDLALLCAEAGSFL